MRIWIDGYEANVPQRLGSSQIAFELIKHIEQLDHKNDYTIVLPEQPCQDMPIERNGFSYKILKPKKLWTRIALPLALYSSKQKPDVIFTPTHYIPRFSPCKRVVTIFDLAFVHFPEMFTKSDLWQLKNWTKYSIENADAIITISKSSKKDIMDIYKVVKEKIMVSYPGYDKQFYKPVSDHEKIARIQHKYQIEGNYIIYIGTIQPRKNLSRLITAVSKIENCKLVIVGKTSGQGRQGWMFDDIINLPKKLNISDRVIFAGFVPTEELPYLIKGALAFVLPSLYEGFGLTLVEAMACGIPVIGSKVSSIPEVVGNAGLLVDPNSQTQIEQAIRTIISDLRLRKKLAKKSIIQAKKFSYKKMAKDVIYLLENLK